MLCSIIGDSLAQGISKYAPNCTSLSVKGITSIGWINKYYHSIPRLNETVVVSLGSNDRGFDDYNTLYELRRNLGKRHVVWVLPRIAFRPRINIKEIADKFGDQIIDARKVPKANELHPSEEGYNQLAKQI